MEICILNRKKEEVNIIEHTTETVVDEVVEETAEATTEEVVEEVTENTNEEAETKEDN